MASKSPHRRLAWAGIAVGALVLVPTAGVAQSPAPIVPDPSITGSVTVGMVANPQMKELQNVLPDFEARIRTSRSTC